MYEIKNEEKFYVLKWNGKEWKEKACLDKPEFLRLVAGLKAVVERWHYDSDAGLYYYPKANNMFLSHCNYSGKDNGVNIYRTVVETALGPVYRGFIKQYMKSIMFCDQDGRIIDPRLYDTDGHVLLTLTREEYLMVLELTREGNTTSRGYVPQVSYAWKYVTRQDRNPEHKKYIRRGACVSKPLVRKTEKSWKRQRKCRKQWEKHLSRHAQYCSLPKVPDESDEFLDESESFWM